MKSDHEIVLLQAAFHGAPGDPRSKTWCKCGWKSGVCADPSAARLAWAKHIPRDSTIEDRANSFRQAVADAKTFERGVAE